MSWGYPFQVRIDWGYGVQAVTFIHAIEGDKV